MIRIAFQSSPIRNLPLSDSFDLVVLIFAIVTRHSNALSATQGRPVSASTGTHYTDGLNAGQGAALTHLTLRYTQDAREEHKR
jgi:hypothetical protein